MLRKLEIARAEPDASVRDGDLEWPWLVK